MSGYKKSNLERFSEGKMGRGLLIWKKNKQKNLHLQIAEPFQTDKAKKTQYWTLIVFRLSGSTALNTGMILTWKPLL